MQVFLDCDCPTAGLRPVAIHAASEPLGMGGRCVGDGAVRLMLRPAARESPAAVPERLEGGGAGQSVRAAGVILALVGQDRSPPRRPAATYRRLGVIVPA